MSHVEYREIPFNYTSANDAQVVRFLFDGSVWSALEELRATRVTGRSARLLMRVMGDLFILRRNPFLLQQLADSRRMRNTLQRTIGTELDAIIDNAMGNEVVLQVTARCRAEVSRLWLEIAELEAFRVRVRRALGAIVGEDQVAFDPFSLITHATDATDWRLWLPAAIVRPTEQSQVAPLLRAIGQLGLHAIARGAGTGLTGGAVPLRSGCVMVNLESLDRIEAVEERTVDTPDGPRSTMVLEAEAGVVTEDAMRRATEVGRVFATDPTSAWACTIGGNIAENAGGKSAVLWGTAIDNLLSYRVALPSGVTCSVRRLEHPLRRIQPQDRVRFEISTDDGTAPRIVELAASDIRKPGLGKDVTNKALGGVPGLQKEGTDGIITCACFVLHPRHEFQRTCCLEFFGPDLREAGRVINLLAECFENRGAEALAALEHFDEEYVRAIDYRTKAPRHERPKAVLLIDMVAHTPDQLETGVRRLSELLEPFEDTAVFWARDEREAARFWQDRKQLGAIARRTNAFKLNEDIVLPLAALPDFARWVDELNLEEERHSQTECIEELEREVARTRPVVDSWWAEQKLPQALHFCDEVAQQLRQASPIDLRERSLLRGLRERLRDLFRGYPALIAAVDGVYERTEQRRIVVATHMHAGDGNVHVNIPVLSNDRDMMLRAVQAADRIMEQAAALGGVVSGEHGIGITKLRHLPPERLQELADYRAKVDPGGTMNPGKLSDLEVLDVVFTPSFNLLELEATILRHHSLRDLADRISKCVRCGKCKPRCCVFIPRAGMYYHPRNKNLAVGALIEALLYQAQRLQSTRFESLQQLEEVADHCTICHKCVEPCPVNIDSGDVSVLEREILAVRGYKHTSLATRLSLRYLLSRSRAFNVLFRALVLNWGLRFQRLGAHVLRCLPDALSLKRMWPLSMLRSPVPRSRWSPLQRSLPRCLPNQAVVVEPAQRPTRTVFYFPGCGSERLFPEVARAAVYILLRSGWRVVLPPPYLCCGFPFEANAKTAELAGKRLGNTIIFTQIREMLQHLDFDACAVSCGTCRESLLELGLPEIFGCELGDASQLARSAGLTVEGGGACLYHRPCHDSLQDRGPELLRECGLGEVRAVPHCCSEAGTLAMSRPDISHQMLVRKADAVQTASAGLPPPLPMLTNCPSCLQGLGRSARLGVTPRHLAVELAERSGGQRWDRELQELLRRSEIVNF